MVAGVGKAEVGNALVEADRSSQALEAVVVALGRDLSRILAEAADEDPAVELFGYSWII